MAEDYGASGLSGLCSDESGIRPFSREDVSRAIDGLSERIRALENSDNERMDYESTRFEQFDRRIDGHSRQFADVDTKLTGIRGELATIAERFETVKAQIERILERFKFLARTFGGD